MAADAFAALPPVPESIEVCGEKLDLTPLKVGEVPAFARALHPVADSLSATPDWLALLANHGDAVIAAVAIAARRPREWVASLDIDDAVRLADAVFEVNTDFFIRRVAPALTVVTERVGLLLKSVPSGPTPSSD